MLDRLALNDGVVLVVDGRALARQHHPVAVFEIADRIGERPERDRVRSQIHFAVAVADRQRRAVAGADHQVVVAGEDEAERERAAQFGQRRPHRLDRLDALLEKVVDQMQHDLGIGFGLEDRPLLFEPFAQFAKILDDAVVDHGDAIGGVRMRVVLGRLAVGGPAGVPDADMAVERFGIEALFQVFQLALGAAAREAVAFQRGDACGIVAAIFKPLEQIDQLLRDRSTSQNADNAAHAVQYPQNDDRCVATRDHS